MTTRTALACIAVAVNTLSVGANPPSDRGRITLEDLASIEPLGQPALSPDGTQFALGRGGQIELMPVEGGWPVPLTTTAGAKTGVAWSPDARTIAFASQGGIWVVPAAGGPPQRLTNAAPGSGDPRTAVDRAPKFSPSGKWILFETGRQGNNDLMVVSADGLRTAFITSTAADEANGAWSPDETHIAYVERTPEQFSGVLKIVDFDAAAGTTKGAPHDLYKAAPDRGGSWSIRTPVWSRDGKQLAIVLQDSGWDKLYLMPAAGGAPTAVTTGSGEDESPVFSPDGKSIAFTSNREHPEERHTWVVPTDGGSPHRVAAAVAGTESGPQWSPDGTKIYFLRSSPLEPANLVVADGAGRTAPRALTHTLPKNFEAAGFHAPEVVHYQSRDGTSIAAMLYKPRDFKPGVRCPAVLWIHGGPEGQDAFSWDPWALFLTQSGYVVLEPNYRGSTGYGEKFRNMNVEDSGGGELDDVVAGAAFIVSQGIADRARLGIGGGSHGGTMVAYAITKQPDLFRVAIELYGVVDRATYNERTNRNAAIRWMMKMGGTPEDKPEVYRKANALADVSRIKAPVLVMHGEDDPQVPPYESAQFVDALKKAGKTYLYFTYPKEGHGFSQRDHKLDAWRKEIAFLNKYLRPEYGQSITATDAW